MKRITCRNCSLTQKFNVHTRKKKKTHKGMKKKTTRFDNRVRPTQTMSLGPAWSMGRPSFIKWHEKKRITITSYIKRALYLHSRKWLWNGDLRWRNGQHQCVYGIERGWKHIKLLQIRQNALSTTWQLSCLQTTCWKILSPRTFTIIGLYNTMPRKNRRLVFVRIEAVE